MRRFIEFADASSAFRIRAFKADGRLPFCSVGASRAFSRMAWKITAEVVPSNGRCPVAIWYSTTPKLNKIAACIERFATRLLGRHIRDRADGRARTGQAQRDRLHSRTSDALASSR